jgi:hypothetical protein
MTTSSNATRPNLWQRIVRGTSGGLAGALAGLGLFILAAISFSMSISPEEPIRRMPMFSRMSVSDFERLCVMGHVIVFMMLLTVGVAAGVWRGRLQIGSRWCWMAYGALAGVALVVLTSYIVDLRFPEAQLFDYSEHAAFEFKFRAATFLGIMGCLVGMVLYHLQPRRPSTGA